MNSSNTLSADVEYIPHDGDVNCRGCSASPCKIIKNGRKRRKVATKWYIFVLDSQFRTTGWYSRLRFDEWFVVVRSWWGFSFRIFLWPRL